MNLGKPPLSVLVLSCLYMAVGAIGFAYHFPRPLAFHHEDVWIEASELLAFVAGVFMLRGHQWARWLAAAWMAFHVAISFPVVHQIAIHSMFLAVIGWVLFQSPAREYFARTVKSWRRLTRLELVHMQVGCFGQRNSAGIGRPVRHSSAPRDGRGLYARCRLACIARRG